MKESSTHLQANPTRGSFGALWQNLCAIDYLMSHLERQKQLLIYQEDNHFKAYVNLGWKKLDKYYNLSDRTFAYRAAVYLNPALKNEWFIKQWSTLHPAWIKKVHKLMEVEYKRYQRLYPHEQLTGWNRSPSSSKELTDFERST